MKLKLNKTLRQKIKANPVSAKAVVISEGKILMLRQQNGNWDLPGGKVNDDESVIEALIREVREETSLSVKPVELLSTGKKRRENEEDLLVLSYLCEVHVKTSSRKVRLSEEHVEYKMIDLGKALSLPLHAHYVQALREARKHIRKSTPSAA